MYGGNRPSSGSDSGSSASSSPRSSPPSTSGQSRNAPDDKKGRLGNIPGVSQGIGGLRSRFGGDKKENKPASPRPSGGASSSGSSSSSGGNALSKGLGGLRSRLPGGGDNKPTTPRSSGGASRGSSSSASSGGNALSKGLGGLRSRLPGGGEKSSGPSASSSAASRPSSTSTGSSSFGGPSRFGSSSSTSSPATSRPRSTEKKPGLGDRLKSALPFGGGTGTKKTSVREKVERASKAPKIDESGLTLDNKLDILGVALLLGSLALFFSSMSSTQGQLTQPILQEISRLLGWGGIAVPIAMFLVGMWLIVRHFGEEAPSIDTVRVGGIVVLYFGLLILFQYIDSFQSYYTLALLDDFLQLSIAAGRGGGWVGAQLYSLLVLNITEAGGMFALAGVFVIGFMLTLRISAAELAVFIISIVRSFNTAVQRRAQARAARARLRAAEQAAAQLSAPSISVSKPAAAELSDGKAAAALPATEQPTLPEPRPIPITKGGKTVTAFFGDGESVPVEADGSSRRTASANSSSLASRLFNAIPLSLPGGSSSSEKSETASNGNGDKPSNGGLLSGGIFSKITSISGRDSGAENVPAKAAEQPVAASAPASASATPAPAAPPPSAVPQQPAASVSPESAYAPPAAQTPPASVPAADRPSYARPQATPPAALPENTPPARLGDLMRSNSGPERTPAPPSTSPPQQPAASAPATPKPAQPELPALDEEKSESEELRSLPPAQPKGTGPVARPQSTIPFTRPTGAPGSGPFSRPASKPADDGDEDGDDEQLPLTERRERLNALRSGQFFSNNRPASTPPSSPSTDKPEEAKPAAQTPPAAPPQRVTAYPSDVPSRPAPKITYTDSDNGRPAASAAPTNGTSQPAANGSPFRRPDTPPTTSAAPPRRKREWRMPDYRTLLNPGSESDFDRQVLLDRARIIEETLQSFGAPGRVVEVNTGPVITQFGVEPDYLVTRSGKRNRVKVGAIAQLDKDLQLALGAKSIRIEAPVPGKGYVGIEVPNEEASLVSLRDVMEADSFQKILKKSPLAIALGQSVDGSPIAADLGAMPHLLVAGTTGSGKSVLVNAIITSLALNNPPDKVKFIMVDPKRVELTGYNGIPHLVAPVVVDLERTVGVLKWVTREMDERYKQFSNAGARNIEDYNNHLSPDVERMPYIVVIIDELADLMMLAPDETERVITRIAALARATGIHLVIATQRPSVDVVTGLIKANFPARVAFAVAGGVDSRVILDQPGAERLLGKGDMLYLSGDSPAPVRLQGVFVSDSEINNITRYWKMQAGDDVPTKPLSALVGESSVPSPARSVDVSSASRSAQQAFWDDDDDDDSDLPGDDDTPVGDDRDELYDQAVEMVRRLNKASVSLLQRRLRIGYTRAARLIDMMEEEGIVGPAQEGSKPREVLPIHQ
ncbi:MAG: hypothetical protein K8L99_09740 [Anaerolineae bacterium]|nr:hypothetical protein [Anaerolineae bacterium]